LQRTLFVANFDQFVEDRDLDQLFSRYGRVEHVRIWRDQETWESRGFGFVEMKDEIGAEQAIEALDGKWWRDRKLKVSVARQKAG
jgi:RNA recognition motif-containing protein